MKIKLNQIKLVAILDQDHFTLIVYGYADVKSKINKNSKRLIELDVRGNGTPIKFSKKFYERISAAEYVVDTEDSHYPSFRSISGFELYDMRILSQLDFDGIAESIGMKKNDFMFVIETSDFDTNSPEGYKLPDWEEFLKSLESKEQRKII